MVGSERCLGQLLIRMKNAIVILYFYITIGVLMMHTTSLRKVGGSIMMVVPPAILDMLDMRAGTTVNIDVDHGRLIVEPQLRPRYTLNELLEQCDALAPMSNDDQAWLDACSVGSELI